MVEIWMIENKIICTAWAYLTGRLTFNVIQYTVGTNLL